MAWVAVGAAAVGAVGSAYAGRQAANAQGRASEANIAEQRRQFDQLQANQQPYMGYGQGSGGIGGLQALANGDYSGFMNSPDYLASQKAGLYALDHSASARGRLNSGGFAADLQNAGQDHAAGFLGNYRNSLQWGANLGQNAAAGVGQAGQNMANANANSRNGYADAQATGYGAMAGGLSSLAGAFAGAYRPGGSSYGGGFGVPAQGSGTMAGFGGTPNYQSGGAGTFWGSP